MSFHVPPPHRRRCFICAVPASAHTVLGRFWACCPQHCASALRWLAVRGIVARPSS